MSTLTLELRPREEQTALNLRRCVEVASPSNSEEELSEKMALYFDAGAKEVWICGMFGEVKFHQSAGALGRSELYPDFPNRI